jgi:hypothetical protein
VRALADLDLKNEPAAEQEFDRLHKSVDPLLGSYSTDKTIEMIRILGAAHAGRWQEVKTKWPELQNRDDKQLAGLAEARANIETGELGAAQDELDTLVAWGRLWGNQRYVAYTNSLSQVLAHYYLGVVYEKTNRTTDAAKEYRSFLTHFDHSDAKLPQIELARAALKRVS